MNQQIVNIIYDAEKFSDLIVNEINGNMEKLNKSARSVWNPAELIDFKKKFNMNKTRILVYE